MRLGVIHPADDGRQSAETRNLEAKTLKREVESLKAHYNDSIRHHLHYTVSIESGMTGYVG